MKTQSVWEVYKDGHKHTFLPPFPTIYHQIAEHALVAPGQDAIVGVGSPKITVPYDQLVTYLNQTANYLHNTLKLNAGDSIALLMENTIELLILNWAAWSLGMRTIPLDIKRDTFDRKHYKTSFTNCKVLFARMDQSGLEETRRLKQSIKGLELIEYAGTAEFFALLSPHSLVADLFTKAHDYDWNQDCLILFTSGTTGLPKGVRLTPYSLWADADQIIAWLQITKDDRFHILLPLHHINSTTFSLATIMAGGTIVLSPRYSKTNFWKIMAQYKATISSIVPTIAYDLLSETTQYAAHKSGLTGISRIQIGSAPVQPSIVTHFYKKYAIPLIQGYGSTETSLRCTGVPLETSASTYLNHVQDNTIGVEMAHDQVTVLNTQGQEVGEGEEGEICVRGANVMQGYIHSPEETQTAFSHGWLHMGDLGYWQYKQGQKYFYLKGRIKEIIIKGGINISPLAIENAILKAFEGIQIVYAFGVSNPRYGEEVAVIVDGTKAAVKALERAIAVKKIPGLTAYESPVVMGQIPIEELPKTSTGKVQRIEIKRLFSESLRLKYLTIATTPAHVFRRIEPDEFATLQRAVTIYNARWPKPITTTIHQLIDQARNGLLIGAFEHTTQKPSGLLGYIAAVQIDLSALKKKEFWTQTWDGITGVGTFRTHNPRGDCLVCCSVTVKEKPNKSNHRNSVQRDQRTSLTPARLKAYLASPKDPVIEFHRRPKGGLTKGARIIQIMPGRPVDTQALGYNVVLQYPLLTNPPVISDDLSLGSQLIEAVMIYGFGHHIRKIVAYSRPAALAQHFRS